MEWQDLWGTKGTGTRSKEMEEVVVGVLISHRTSIMKKAPKEEAARDESPDMMLYVEILFNPSINTMLTSVTNIKQLNC